MKKSWSDDSLRVAVANSITIAEVLRSLGLSVSPGNYPPVKRRIQELNLEVSHLKGKSHGTSRVRKRSTEDLLKVGGTISSSKLKTRLLKEELLENRCYSCDLGPLWCEKPLSLQLHHVNGDPQDNRLENLRILCPNCHTQTSTFTGRNKVGRYKAPPKLCPNCGKSIQNRSLRCTNCKDQKSQPKITWPNATYLAKEVEKTSYTQVARSLGISGNAVKKHLKKMLGAAPVKKGTCAHRGT